MAKKSVDSFSNSLKAKIWLSTVALAFFVCTFGSLSYLVVSFLINDPFYSIFIPFLLLAMTIVAFGLWLSNEIVNPVENVLLLAKSFERGVSTSLPRTSGSKETDELLETIQRISGQVQRLLHSMDSVAQGNLDAVHTQNSNSDRISLAFQKLLAKVSESIHAKQELEKLQSAVDRLSAEATSIRDSKPDAEVNTDNKATREISLTINHLVELLGELTMQVKNSTVKSRAEALEIEKTVNNLIRQDESRESDINQATLILKKVPQLVQKISEEISQSASSTTQSLEKVRRGMKNSQLSFDAVSRLRKQIQESARRIQKLNECSQEIETAAQAVGDLTHRTNLVALNASIQAAELGEEGKSFIIIAEEIERLAVRADKTNRHLNALNKAIESEIEKVGDSLETIVSEAANFSKFTIETGNLNGDLERYLSRYLNLQEKIVNYTREETADTEKAFQALSASAAKAPNFAKSLKESAQTISRITHSMETLHSAAHYSGFTLSAAPLPNEAAEALKSSSEKVEGETFL